MYPNRKHYASDFVSNIGSIKTHGISPEFRRMKNFIKKLRLDADWSQQRLANEVGGGCTKATIMKLESGQMGLTTEWMGRIAKALKCSPCQLIEENYRTTEDLRASEAALVYAIKEIMSMLLGQKRPTKKNFINDLGFALNHYRDLPGAALVLEDLLAHAVGEPHQEEQQTIRKLLQLAPPKSA